MAISISDRMGNKRLNTMGNRVRYGDESVVSVVAPEISKDVRAWALKCSGSNTIETLQAVGNVKP